MISFEKPNKLAARLIKLGEEKTDESVHLGQRELFVVDSSLTQNGLPDLLTRMLSLGTIWVNGPEFEKLGHVRVIPCKGVTAPLPLALGSLEAGQWLLGANSWKSKLNGLLWVALGMPHSEIRKITESEARHLLVPFLSEVTIAGYTIPCYKVNMDVYGTNFYSLYGLDGHGDSEEEDVSPVALRAKKRGIYASILSEITTVAMTGEVFDVNSAVRKLLEDKILERKPRTVSVTSAEVQQVEISHGIEAAMGYVDSLMTRRNVMSKSFLFEKADSLQSVAGQKVKEWAYKYLDGEAHSAVVPFRFGEFVNHLMERLKGNDFVVRHNGYDFVIPAIPKLYSDEDGYVDEVPFGLSILVKLVASLRNPGTDWKRKWCDHALELGSNLGNKIQDMKVSGAYLPAISGYWLRDGMVTSYGDPWGKVTAAKLPILFDKAVTSLRNSDMSSPYGEDEVERYRQSFEFSCFVSQEFFVSQQNDGDGDLIKITKGFSSIPFWTGQIYFSQPQVEKYTVGELELKLKLSPYSEMPLAALGEGSEVALKAKEDVARMASNGYKVKAHVSRFIRAPKADAELRLLSLIVAEASAYVVQNESMRAIKHDGGKALFDIIKCQNLEMAKIGVEQYRDAWIALIHDYFGVTVQQDNKNLQLILKSLASQRLGGLGLHSVNEKALSRHLCVQEPMNVIFCLMQKSHVRSLKSASQQWAKDSALPILEELVKTKAHVGFAYSGLLRKVVKDNLATDIFSYFMSRLDSEYTRFKADESQEIPLPDAYDYVNPDEGSESAWI
jgi:hypothetical protein